MRIFAPLPMNMRSDGFLAVAPALFDRIERDVDLGYEGADVQKAMSFIPRLDIDKAVADVAAALDLRKRQPGKKAGVIGYCFGGTIAWLAATRLHPDAAVGYYGGRIGNYAAENPSCPVMLHFGRQDTHIWQKRWRRCIPRIPRSRFTGTMPGMRSMPLRGPATTLRRQSWRGHGRSRF